MNTFIALLVTSAALVSCSVGSIRHEQRRPETRLGADEPFPFGISMEDELRKRGIEARPANGN